MQVRVVLAVGRAHRGDLLATRDPLTATDEHFLKMTVKGVDVFHVAALAVSVPHDYDVAPAKMNVAGENHNAVSGAVNCVAQIGVAAASAVPIFAHVSAGSEPARFVITFRFGFADGEIEAVGDLGKAHVER